MAEVTVGHHPELIAEEAMKVFQRHFSEYEVYKSPLLSGVVVKRDFAIKKSAWIGVSVALKQEPGKTSFVITYFIPSLIRNAFGGLFAMLFRRSRYKAMENEVKSFIEKAEEFAPLSRGG